ncbi:DUF3859 domain-containing protein [Roseibacterium beibuensis]|uniref:DUF3859 domain-containing protein n=1 Tax=[Roseibacterium] beibuensis TaxID=1193142 RepID=A0ABP9LF54_9RHOB|nr:DUF3859 domain-containing protein [Roseibacterium beibuensis]MCS6626702.1 DUF3859 domain-containing protein [Roseibacterium beibuensis]
MIRPVALCLCLLVAPAIAQEEAPLAPSDAADNPRIGALIDEIEWGVYCAQDPVRLEDAPDTAAGTINIVQDLPQIRFEDTVVPAALGMGFGVLARVAEGTDPGPVTVTVTHPPYPGSGITVERWIATMNDTAMSLFGFSFETQDELVTGTWTLIAEANGDELFHIRFEIVPPDFARPMVAACQGGFMS